MNPGVESLPLRDIHLPAGVSWWPPAVGWWILLGLLLVLIVLVMVVRHIKKRKQFSRLALSTLNMITEQYKSHGDSQKLLEDLSALMRRVTINAYPESHAAGLTGEAWLRFLDELAAKLSAKKVSAKFDSPIGQWLVTAPYQKQITAGQQDIQQLLTLCREWILAVSRRAHPTLEAGAH